MSHPTHPGDVPNSLANYIQDMKRTYAFTIINVEPRWVPCSGDIEGFCHDEVVRQMHDPRVRLDGGLRIEWMLSAWNYATRMRNLLPTLQDVINLGLLVEPEENMHGFRNKELYIRGNIGGSHPGQIHGHMVRLMDRVADVVPVQGKGEPGGDFTADDFYLEYEHVHPFGDGNGRTGKVLHNWLLGTLEDPVLVADYFGGGHA